MKKYALVFITWVDAESRIDWQDTKEIKQFMKKDCLVNEVGWLVYENKKYYLVASQIIRGDMIGNKTKIPKKWVKKIKYDTPKTKR